MILERPDEVNSRLSSSREVDSMLTATISLRGIMQSRRWMVEKSMALWNILTSLSTCCSVVSDCSSIVRSMYWFSSPIDSDELWGASAWMPHRRMSDLDSQVVNSDTG